MKKKGYLFLSVLLLLALPMLVFAGGAQEEEKTELVFWTHDHGPMVDTHNQLIEEYQTEHPNITVVYRPFPWTEFETAIVTNIATGGGPDLFGCWDLWTAPFADKGLLSPVDHEAFGYESIKDMKDDFVYGSLGISSRAGKTYGVPFEFNSYCLYLNSDQYREVGLNPEVDAPRTWDELIEIAKKLVIMDSSGNFKREGFDLFYLGPLITAYYTNPFFAQAEATWFNEDETECVLDSEEAIKAMELVGSFVNTHKIGSPKAGNLNPTMGEQDFIDEQTSMIFAAPWLESVLKDKPIGDHYRIAPLPQMKGGKKATHIYGWYWTVASPSENKKEAWSFINFVSQNQLLWYENVSFIQPRSPEWMTSPEASEVKTDYFDVFVDGFTFGETVPFTTHFTELSDSLNKAYEDIMFNNANVRDVMERAKQEVDAALK